jgi:CSLREA domain-containing protein
MNARTHLIAITGVAAAALVCAPGASATTMTVNDTTDDIGAGGTCTLREAIDQANTNADGRGCDSVGPYADNDTIVLSDPAGYTLTRAQTATPDDNLEGDLDINPITAGTSLTITSTVPTSINGGAVDRVLDVLPGGILNVQGVTIRGGQADFGSGVRVNAGGATLDLTGVTLTDNRAVSSFGGGISSQGTTTLTNSTVSDNASVTSGGGISVSAGTTTLSSVTVSDNTADVDGDELGNGGGVDVFGGTINLRDTIVAGNIDGSDPAQQAADCAQPAGTIGSLGNNLIGTTVGCFYVAAAGDRTNQAPLLGALAANGGPTSTHALLAGSPAIGGGSVMCPATDQRGIARPQGTVCDIGAFERQPDATPAPVPASGKAKRKCKKRKRKGGKRAASAKRKKCKKRKKRKRRN